MEPIEHPEQNEHSEPAVEVTTAPEPSKPIHSSDELFERMEKEDPALADEVIEAVGSGDEPATPKAKDTKVQSEFAAVKQIQDAVTRLEHDKAEFQAACQQIEEMFQRNEINADQYNQAVANARVMDIQLREGALINQAAVSKLQSHYAGMIDNLEKQFPDEWNAKNRATTAERIYNFAEKNGVPRQLISELAETPQALPFLTRMMKMDAELKRLKGESLRRNKPAPMASKVASLAEAQEKKRYDHNSNVGYFGSKDQNSQLDKISKLLGGV